MKRSHFLAFDEGFFDIIGPSATLERIQAFGPSEQHVHEAPVYLPDSNELLYSDTSLAGTLFAIDIDTHKVSSWKCCALVMPSLTFGKVRKISLNPPLPNINGATPHPSNDLIYVATNGGSVRGLFALNTTSGLSQPILNNFRGRHFNSPNDLIFDANSNIYFTDPTYGWNQKWPGVQEPELPNGIYCFNRKSGQVTTLSNSHLKMPNGLALSKDEKTLYVADSSSANFGLAEQRAVFAFDIRADGLLDGPRLVHQVESGWPDGLRVTDRGYLMVAVAGGVDVVDPRDGRLMGKINSPDDWIFNLEPARGRDGIWLLTGKNGIYKAVIQEKAVERRGMLDLGPKGLVNWLLKR